MIRSWKKNGITHLKMFVVVIRDEWIFTEGGNVTISRASLRLYDSIINYVSAAVDYLRCTECSSSSLFTSCSYRLYYVYNICQSQTPMATNTQHPSNLFLFMANLLYISNVDKLAILLDFSKTYDIRFVRHSPHSFYNDVSDWLGGET